MCRDQGFAAPPEVPTRHSARWAPGWQMEMKPHAAWLSLADSPDLAWRLAACRAPHACCPVEMAHEGGLLKVLQREGKVAVKARGGINEYLEPMRKAELGAAVQAYLRNATDSWYATSPRTQLNYGGKGAGQQLWFTDSGSWRVTQPGRLMRQFNAELPSEVVPATGNGASTSDSPAGGSGSGLADAADTSWRVGQTGKRQRKLDDGEDHEDFLPSLEVPLLQDIDFLPTLSSDLDACETPNSTENMFELVPGLWPEVEPPTVSVEEAAATHDRVVQQPALQPDSHESGVENTDSPARPPATPPREQTAPQQPSPHAARGLRRLPLRAIRNLLSKAVGLTSKPLAANRCSSEGVSPSPGHRCPPASVSTHVKPRQVPKSTPNHSCAPVADVFKRSTRIETMATIKHANYLARTGHYCEGASLLEESTTRLVLSQTEDSIDPQPAAASAAAPGTVHADTSPGPEWRSRVAVSQGWVRVSVGRGDSLQKLAIAHGLDVSAIRSANSIFHSELEPWRDEIWLPANARTRTPQLILRGG